MEAGLLSLAARRLAEMSETDAENKITRLQPDELASLVRYYNKKERERLAPQADVNEVAIKIEHRTRSPSLEVVSTRPCNTQHSNVEQASEIASSGLDTIAPGSTTLSNSGQDTPPIHSHSMNVHPPIPEDRPEHIFEFEAQSTAATSGAKLSIPEILSASERSREQTFTYVLWIPDSQPDGIWGIPR